MFDKLERQSLPRHEDVDPCDYGPARVTYAESPCSELSIEGIRVQPPLPVTDQSVERRNSRGLSGLAGAGLAPDLTGSILALSTAGVSTRADTSTEPVRSGGCSARGWATARASNICAAP